MVTIVQSLPPSLPVTLSLPIRCWEGEQQRAAAKSVPASYARALWSCFGCRYLLVGLLAAAEECILRWVLGGRPWRVLVGTQGVLVPVALPSPTVEYLSSV